jgi:RNA polymerase sigma factor (sigma-70 family)
MSGSTQLPIAAAEELQWLQRLSSRDAQIAEDAWTEFLHAYVRVVMQVISACERDSENRHECFVYACEQLCRNRFHRLRQFQPEGPATFSTWLRAVVRNLCVDWQRKAGRHRVVVDLYVRSHALRSAEVEPAQENDAAEQLADPSPDPEGLAVKREELLTLGSGLRLLTSKQQLALRLRFRQELTLQEIARVLNLKNAQAADRFVQETIALLRRTVDSRPNFPGKTNPASV